MHKILFFVVTLMSLNCFAQSDTAITRLKNDLDKEKDLNTKLDIIERISFYSERYSPSVTAEYLNEGILLAEQSRQRDLMVKARRIAANAYLGNGNDQARTELAKNMH